MGELASRVSELQEEYAMMETEVQEAGRTIAEAAWQVGWGEGVGKGQGEGRHVVKGEEGDPWQPTVHAQPCLPFCPAPSG